MMKTIKLKGNSSGQDISWFIDMFKNGKLDLSPRYQRRSVWTQKDRKYFLDTIFRGFPCPPVYLHKTLDEKDVATYHVVDGKQRLETILLFVEDKISLDREMSDTRLAGKKWKDLKDQADLKNIFWDYTIPVEQIYTDDGTLIDNVFDRLNRNSRKLTRQEMRHAKFDGWLIAAAEAESLKDEWESIGICTKTRAKRMQDVQFLSELLLVILENKQFGFDQDHLDSAYAKYDDLDEFPADAPSLRIIETKLTAAKKYLTQLESHDNVITKYASNFGHFYTLWSTIILWPNSKLPSAEKIAPAFRAFMVKVAEISTQEDIPAFLAADKKGEYAIPYAYFSNTTGASTDFGPREARKEALMKIFMAQ